MKNIVNIILILLFANNSDTFCQKFQSYNTKEMQKALNENGIDSMFKYISPRTPLFIIDPFITTQIALKCNFDDEKQTEFLLNTSSHIADSLLAIKVIKYLQYIRENIDIKDSYTWRTPNKIFKSLIFQNDTNLKSFVLKEYEFWKNLGDSLFPFTDSSEIAYSKTNFMYSTAQYNYFKLAYVLSELGAKDFNKEAVLKLGSPDLTINGLNSIETLSLNSKPDTVLLKNNYNSLSQINFKHESQFNIFPLFGQILTTDNDYAVLYYNLNHGLILLGYYKDQRESRYQLLEITLIEGNKLIIKPISGGIS